MYRLSLCLFPALNRPDGGPQVPRNQIDLLQSPLTILLPDEVLLLIYHSSLIYSHNVDK